MEGCRKRGKKEWKERRDSGLEGYTKGMDSGLKGFRIKGIQERRDTGKDGNRKGGFRTEGMRNRRDADDIHERKKGTFGSQMAQCFFVRCCSFVSFRFAC